MWVLLLVAFGLTCATVVVHGLGTLEVIRRLGRANHERPKRIFHAGIQVIRVVSLLLLLHLVEAGLWAAFYRLGGILPDMETAVYFSITSYTTVGYGDVVLPASWRLLGPVEAAVGILMFGWSTSIMVAAITKSYGARLRLKEEQVEGNERPHD